MAVSEITTEENCTPLQFVRVPLKHVICRKFRQASCVLIKLIGASPKFKPRHLANVDLISIVVNAEMKDDLHEIY